MDIRHPHDNTEFLDDIIEFCYTELSANTRASSREEWTKIVVDVTKPDYAEHTLCAVEDEQLLGCMLWNTYGNSGRMLKGMSQLHQHVVGNVGGWDTHAPTDADG